MWVYVLIVLATLHGFWSEFPTVVADDSTATRTGSVADQKPAQSAQSSNQGRSPRIVFITSKECAECDRILEKLQKPGGDFATMKSLGWKIGDGPDNHIQVVDKDSVADFVKELGVREFPTVACIQDGEILRAFKQGCTTPLDSWTFGWLIKGVNERPGPVVPERITVETTGNYPLRGNHWSVEGAWSPSKEYIVSHLRGPTHASQIRVSWKIESWSYEELRSLHDDLHEREMGGAVASNQSQSFQQSTTRGFSPSNSTNKFFGKY
ncbi:MAG: hypothetical protein FJ267_08425 [Planctomycetes bacterium]|nr:hypothetical protein [Planctomycetota bacterium]